MILYLLFFYSHKVCSFACRHPKYWYHNNNRFCFIYFKYITTRIVYRRNPKESLLSFYRHCRRYHHHQLQQNHHHHHHFHHRHRHHHRRTHSCHHHHCRHCSQQHRYHLHHLRHGRRHHCYLHYHYHHHNYFLIILVINTPSFRGKTTLVLSRVCLDSLPCSSYLARIQMFLRQFVGRWSRSTMATKHTHPNTNWRKICW